MKLPKKEEDKMTDYTKIEKEVDAQANMIWDVASNVWEFAELGYEEFKSSAYESEVLEKNGFAISDRASAASIPPGLPPGAAAPRSLASWWSSTPSRGWAMIRYPSRHLQKAVTPTATAAAIT